MKKSMISLLVCSSLAIGLAPAAQAKPGGCLKYGAAGAVAGHAVHHGVRGFLAGCAAGMVRRHYYNKQQRSLGSGAKSGPMASPTSSPTTGSPSTAPTTAQ